MIHYRTNLQIIITIFSKQAIEFIFKHLFTTQDTVILYKYDLKMQKNEKRKKKNAKNMQNKSFTNGFVVT